MELTVLSNARRRVVARILVVCGAGASSTFLVHWIRRVCASRGIAAEVKAGAVELLETEVLNADVVLVGRPLHGGSWISRP